MAHNGRRSPRTLGKSHTGQPTHLAAEAQMADEFLRRAEAMIQTGWPSAVIFYSHLLERVGNVAVVFCILTICTVYLFLNPGPLSMVAGLLENADVHTSLGELHTLALNAE